MESVSARMLAFHDSFSCFMKLLVDLVVTGSRFWFTNVRTDSSAIFVRIGLSVAGYRCARAGLATNGTFMSGVVPLKV